MSNPHVYSDFAGTRQTAFSVATGALKFLVKAITGGFVLRNAADTADADLTVNKLNVSGASIDINSDAAGSGADWKYTLTAPASGMTAALNLVFPPNVGSPNFMLITDGAGNTSWAAQPGGATNVVQTDTTALAFGDSSPVSMFSKPAGSKVKCVRIYVDTAFNGTPSLSIGISGTTSKYGATSDVDLTVAGIYEWDPGIDVVVGAESLIATYSAGGATTGAARIDIDYVTPT